MTTRWVEGTRRAAFLWLVAVSAVAGQARADRIDVSEPVTYFIAEGSASSGFRDGDRMLAQWALEAWARQLESPVRLVRAPEETATIRIYWASPEDGLYGEMRERRVGGRFAADVFVHPDTEALGREIDRHARLDGLFRETVVYLTCVHELGHAFGLPHTAAFADIMYSFQ